MNQQVQAPVQVHQEIFAPAAQADNCVAHQDFQVLGFRLPAQSFVAPVDALAIVWPTSFRASPRRMTSTSGNSGTATLPLLK